MSMPIPSFRRAASLCLATVVYVAAALPQINFTGPRPGDVYREYTRTMSGSGDTWRVTDPNINLGVYPAADPFVPNPTLSIAVDDLQGALRAEAVITLWGGHVGTTGKKLRFNNHEWIPIPELGAENGIPAGHSGQCYLHEPTVTIDIPLSHLVNGTNYFQGENSGQTCYNFGWGQHGWYNLMLRVYYDPAQKPHPSGQISSPASGNTLGENPTITASVTGGNVDRIDVLASYWGYDTDGDGIYSGYHYDYQPISASNPSMSIRNHVGTLTGTSRQLTWNTEWVPDQAQGGVKLIARIRDVSGVWYCTDEVTGLSLERSESVRLYVSPALSERAWARGDLPVVTCPVEIPSSDPVGDAIAAAYHIRTWNGLDNVREPGETHYRRFNGWTDGEYGLSHFYSYDVRTVPLNMVKEGTNTLTFYSQTTKHHGIEILWPGPALTVRYRGATSSATVPHITAQPARVSVRPGETATFSVTATGSLPLTYQWQQDGNDISGATSSSYTTAPVTADDDGRSFRCVISNSYGTVTSAAAVLSVAPGVVNLVANPGFEQGTSPWVLLSDGSASFATDTVGPASAHAARIAVDVIGANLQLYQAGIPLKEDSAYTLMFKACSNSGHDISVSIHKHGSPYNSYGLYQRGFDLTPSWSAFRADFRAGGFSGSVVDGRLMFWLGSEDAPGDRFYVDDVVLAPTSAIEGSSDVPWHQKETPVHFYLAQNHPNPFNPSTMIRFGLAAGGFVSIKVYNLLGQEVRTLVDEFLPAGEHGITFQASGLPSGVYLYRMVSGGFAATKKLVLVK